MKSTNLPKLLALAVSSVVLTVYGCGGGGGGGTTGGDTGGSGGTTTTISNASQAGSAGGSTTQGASVGANSGQTLSNLASPVGAPKYRSPLVGKDPRFNKMHAAEVRAMKAPTKHYAAFVKKAKAMKAGSRVPGTGDESCTDGGSVNVSGTYGTSNFSNIIMTYSNCREGGEQLNGTITVTDGTITSSSMTFSMTIGDGDGTIENNADFRVEMFSDNYTNLFARYTADMTMSGSMDLAGSSFSFTANGKEDYSDFIDTYSMTFTNVIFSSTMGTASGSDTVNGVFTESWTGTGGTESVSITFGDADTSAELTTNTNPDFTIAWATGTNYYEFSVDGKIVTDFTTSDADCLDGTFLIDTTTPVRQDSTTGETTAGRVVINDATVIVFNSDGTVSVSISGGTPTNYNSMEDLENVCPIEDMEQDSSSSTDVGTSGQTQNTTGSTMTITALTSGTSLDCYTDVHVKYYNTLTPTNATTETWMVDWRSSDGCTSPTGTTYEQAYDITGDGVCDIGLDIRGSAYDSWNNGIEHFTAMTLPVGYYVVSVNNYSCATDVTNNVSIQIGSSLYTGYTGTYTTYDYDGASTGAWFRVADIKVNSDGSVNLIAPDTSLTPWHSPLLAPAIKSPRRR